MNASPASPGKIGLILLLTAQMLPLIDTSITNVALDSITRSLASTATDLELIVALYGVAFAVCLAVGSKLGDNYGRRRVLLAGVVIFGIASLFCGLAGSVNTLLVSRTIQGAGAALIVPQILATLHVTLKGTAHARAISLYSGIGGIAFIIGQMGGGWLVSADIAGLGWRNAFFINVPICLLVLLFSRHFIPETRSDRASRIDWQGTLLLAIILCCLLFPLALGPSLHWPWQMQVMLLITVPLALLMRKGALAQQQRGQQPLLPPHLLKLPGVRFSLLIAFLFFSCWSGFMFCMALTLQAGAGMGPLQSGNSFIVLGVAYFLSALYAPKLIRRYSTAPVLLTGILIQVSGVLVLMMTLWILGNSTGALAIAPGSILLGLGQAIIVNCFYRVGMRDIPASDAGAGSAILSTLQQAALGLGPAVAGAVYLHQYHQQGSYPQAMAGFLAAEALVMLILAAATLIKRKSLAELAPAGQ
ncbi:MULTISPECIES: MFS transporter [unclassified Tatumella]|uniref:MFS transporter n=1 Tax=unclassified Tatumella TaxID=2649542 RepID=UPI001BB02360|nr:MULTISPECIES: MFS transporter [unclassified Tatumella]MBS0856036.1 MFS transporter [Tatumella sp. JGM16]MBS0913015.1 MFS transporter [Tatumella sp. JGM91]